MKGVYDAVIKISSLAATKTLIYITAPSSMVVEILSAEISNATNETNEQLEACLKRIGTLGTPTATTLTPSKHENGDAAASSTAKGNVTASEPTYTANTEIGYSGFASLAGWRYDPIPEERPIIQPSGSMGLLLVTSTNTAFDALCRVTFREIG